MASEYVQTKINYGFADIELLHSALKAADRSDEDGSSSDGNRGLARIGLSVMDMVETHNIIIVENGTKRDANARDHWFKSRQGRARACEKFGIDTCIVQGAQQSHQKPSSKVLAYALCAIIGAVWLDMEKQNESALSTREQVFGILRRIDDAMEDTTEGHRSTTGESTSSASEGNEGIQRCILGGASEVIEPNQLSDEDIVQADAFMFQWFEQTQHEIFWSMDPALFSFHSMQPETNIVPLSEFQTYVKATGILNSDLSAIGHISNGIALPGSGGEMEHSEQRIQTGSGRIDDAPQGYSNASENAQTAVRPAKRKYSHDHCGRLRSSSLQPDLLHDELGKLNSFPVSIRSHLEALVDDPRIGDLGTDPSQVKQLRLFYFAIGSCQSLIEFKENLRAARSMPSGSIHSFGANLCLTERVREICRLDDQEALCVLARRYHIVKLFETELETLRQNNEMIMETPSTFGTTLRAQPGNPVMMQEAALTDGLICRIKPGLKKGTKEFQKFRAKLSQLRRLAKVLRMLTQTYGFGILALLPCGPSYSELAITDRTLLSITEQRFRKFSDLLYRQQGPILKELSKAVEPALTAFVNGDLVSASPFPIESMEESAFEGQPKGSPAIFEHLLGQTSAGNRRSTT